MNQKTSLAIPISSLALLDFIVSEFRLEVMLWTIDSFIRNHHNVIFSVLECLKLTWLINSQKSNAWHKWKEIESSATFNALAQSKSSPSYLNA